MANANSIAKAMRELGNRVVSDAPLWHQLYDACATNEEHLKNLFKHPAFQALGTLGITAYLMPSSDDIVDHVSGKTRPMDTWLVTNIQRGFYDLLAIGVNRKGGFDLVWVNEVIGKVRDHKSYGRWGYNRLSAEDAIEKLIKARTATLTPEQAARYENNIRRHRTNMAEPR